ncbi:hypothetical protein OTSGILL_0937 [Orientia tsutsugamushi str. Gilliam]|uniref:Uncharacterized protein n=1 Tax=Orientia tsutsugamushi str. Gilliam TaxID=1359184 RepID=A0A0F3MC76_ORITS|nr:hypothetical protein OTSGILL_0937 [Orientia tsutsugamushi str. Gilliam]
MQLREVEAYAEKGVVEENYSQFTMKFEYRKSDNSIIRFTNMIFYTQTSL